MNSFKLMFAVCSVIAVASGQYMQSGRPSYADNQMNLAAANQAAPANTGTEGSIAGQIYTYTYNNEATTTAPNAGAYEQTQQAGPASAPAQEQSYVSAPAAPTQTNIPASAFPAVTQQICTCVVVPDSTTAAMVDQSQQTAAAQQQSAAPVQQTYAAQQQSAAPAQQTYTAQHQSAAPSQQTYAAQQQTSSQSGSYTAQQSAPARPSGDRVARPAYATAAKAAGY